MSEGVASIGSCMAFSAAAPATIDASGYGDVTWTASGEIENIGDIGPENEVISFADLCSGTINKRVGATDNGTQSLTIIFDINNAAQVILNDGANNKTPVYCRESLASGDIYYYRAYVASAKTSVGGSGDVIKYNVDLAIDGALVEVAA